MVYASGYSLKMVWPAAYNLLYAGHLQRKGAVK